MNFRRLEVYQTALRFLPVAAVIADGLPPRSAALADQLRWASVSIPLNIAEGSGKNSGPDQRRFYAIARGSAMECAAVMDVCQALNLAPRDQVEEADLLLAPVIRRLSRMCRIQNPQVQDEVEVQVQVEEHVRRVPGVRVDEQVRFARSARTR